ncbi:MAG: DUF6519 domain-containing protein [Planctomycetota bacterium]
MKGDFSRDSHNQSKQYSRVLMQQGRVQLDADWNEQAALLLQAHRQSLADQMGGHGTWTDEDRTEDATAFRVSLDADGDLVIGDGHYYVAGVRCFNESPFKIKGDTAAHFAAEALLAQEDNQVCLIYLDVWERFVSHLEDNAIREVALGGADSSGRTQITWQVKGINITPIDGDDDDEKIQNALEGLKHTRATLRARARHDNGTRPKTDADPGDLHCNKPLDTGFRGLENSLYRVEIDNWLANGDLNQSDTKTRVRFKWSRDNGSVAFPVKSISGNDSSIVKFRHSSQDPFTLLEEGDTVELIDPILELRSRTGVLQKVKQIDRVDQSIVLEPLPEMADSGFTTLFNNSVQLSGTGDRGFTLRRWDGVGEVHFDNSGPLPNGNPLPNRNTAQQHAVGDWKEPWFLLGADGVEIQFVLPEDADPSADDAPYLRYRPGDHWLIPARTNIEDILWNWKKVDDQGQEKEIPDNVPPHGILDDYAPLATVKRSPGGLEAPIEKRRVLKRQTL